MGSTRAWARRRGRSFPPVLANVFLHYVLDLWFHRKWRLECSRQAKRSSSAMPTILWSGSNTSGMRSEYLRDVRERLTQFGLSLHPDKTRLVEFGRFAVMNRRGRGAGKPDTFDFPGPHALLHDDPARPLPAWSQTGRETGQQDPGAR